MKSSTAGIVPLVVASMLILLVPGNRASGQTPRNLDLASDITKVDVLLQNWSDEQAQWFYNVPQGLKLMRYEFFLHLEQAGSDKPFRDAENIRRMGYLARKPDRTGNPDGLPIGFVKDDRHLALQRNAK